MLGNTMDSGFGFREVFQLNFLPVLYLWPPRLFLAMVMWMVDPLPGLVDAAANHESSRPPQCPYVNVALFCSFITDLQLEYRVSLPHYKFILLSCSGIKSRSLEIHWPPFPKIEGPVLFPEMRAQTMGPHFWETDSQRTAIKGGCKREGICEASFSKKWGPRLWALISWKMKLHKCLLSYTLLW